MKLKGKKGQHSFLVLETDTSETATTLGEQKQPEVEIKDLCSDPAKRRTVSGISGKRAEKDPVGVFLLPDLYVGYTTDFNRATAQTAMEVTEKAGIPARKEVPCVDSK